MPYPPPCPSRTPARIPAVCTRVPVGLKSDQRGACAPAPRLGPLLALGLLAGAPAVLAAPDAADLLDLPFADLLEVEIRSAGKREEQIRDIPASVTILTRGDIARYG
jgi:outer membrane receptor protein involved in Fe transport